MGRPLGRSLRRSYGQRALCTMCDLRCARRVTCAALSAAGSQTNKLPAHVLVAGWARTPRCRRLFGSWRTRSSGKRRTEAGAWGSQAVLRSARPRLEAASPCLAAASSGRTRVSNACQSCLHQAARACCRLRINRRPLALLARSAARPPSRRLRTASLPSLCRWWLCWRC